VQAFNAMALSNWHIGEDIAMPDRVVEAFIVEALSNIRGSMPVSPIQINVIKRHGTRCMWGIGGQCYGTG